MGRELLDGAGEVEQRITVPVELVEQWTRPPETGAAYHGGVGTRGQRMSRENTLDTRPVQSASKRVFDRGGRHRRTWRQVHVKFLILYANLAKLNHCKKVI